MSDTGIPAAMAGDITSHAIASVATLIRPYVLRTPVVFLDRAAFGLEPGPLVLKLEQLQHSGSFKARGAFANLLLRPLPDGGVVAASGGNHGAAVAYAAQALGVTGPRVRARRSRPRPRSSASAAMARTWSSGAPRTPRRWPPARNGRPRRARSRSPRSTRSRRSSAPARWAPS